MKYYVDITLLPSDDIGIHFLWQKLYQQVHLALVEAQATTKNASIAACFPEYRASKGKSKAFLGNKLRLLAQSQEVINQLNIEKWLNRLSDYIHIKETKAVPADITSYAQFSRYQPKAPKERLARRRAKKHQQDYETALAHYADMDETKTKLPFIQLASLSSDNRFNLYIKHEPVDTLIDQGFSPYGLSPKSSIPMF